MTLLDDIIDGASGQEPVASLLRKLKIVAARTGTPVLANWIGQELNGYEDGLGVPSYRGPLETMVLGHFVGPFNSEVRNVPIPPSTFIDVNLATGALFRLWIKNPVAEVEQWATQDSVTIAWPADALQLYNWGIHKGEIRRVVIEGMVLASAIRPMEGTVFVGMLDAVRTRVLDLALELEQVAPSAGQRETPSNEKKLAENAINNFNFYASSNVAVSSHSFTQNTTLPGPGDVQGLLNYLTSAGLSPKRLGELRVVIEEDQQAAETSGTPTRWERTKGWLTQAGTDVSTGALGGVVSTAAMAFLS